MKYPPSPDLDWPLPYPAVLEIADDEKGPDLQGAALKAYLCSAGVWTYGWGETDNVGPNSRCTREQADRMLCDDLTERVRQVRLACKVEPNANQLAAMVRLSYNIGLPGFLGSTVLKAHNRGDFEAAAGAFRLWNKITDPETKKKVVSNGLTERRLREAATYLRPVDAAQAPARMPQAVEPESKLTASPIAKGGTATIGAGVVTAIVEAKESLGSIGDVARKGREILVDTLGVPVEWLLPIALVALGAMIVRQRLLQRSGGWA